MRTASRRSLQNDGRVRKANTSKPAKVNCRQRKQTRKTITNVRANKKASTAAAAADKLSYRNINSNLKRSKEFFSQSLPHCNRNPSLGGYNAACHACKMKPRAAQNKRSKVMQRKQSPYELTNPRSCDKSTQYAHKLSEHSCSGCSSMSEISSKKLVCINNVWYRKIARKDCSSTSCSTCEGTCSSSSSSSSSSISSSSSDSVLSAKSCPSIKGNAFCFDENLYAISPLALTTKHISKAFTAANRDGKCSDFKVFCLDRRYKRVQPRNVDQEQTLPVSNAGYILPNQHGFYPFAMPLATYPGMPIMPNWLGQQPVPNGNEQAATMQATEKNEQTQGNADATPVGNANSVLLSNAENNNANKVDKSLNEIDEVAAKKAKQKMHFT